MFLSFILSFFKFLCCVNMPVSVSRAPTKIAPTPVSGERGMILYNLDEPMNVESVRVPAVKDMKDVKGTIMKFFDQPIYILLHAVVRKDDLTFSKVLTSIEKAEMEFFRAVEKKIMDHYDALLSRSDPSIDLTHSIFSSATYQDTLFRAKITSATLPAVSVDGVQTMVYTNDELKTGAKVLMTYAITGVHHSSKFHGLIGHVQSYVVVK